jgi:hypothetical protein
MVVAGAEQRSSGKDTTMTSDASPTTPSPEETISIIRQIWDAAADNYDSLWGMD